MIYPVPGLHDWVKTATADIEPHMFTSHPCRPKKNRIKGVNEPPTANGKARMTTTTCSNCKKQGHKFPTCPVPLRDDLKIRKDNHKSYICHSQLRLHLLLLLLHQLLQMLFQLHLHLLPL